jgi:8-oxo-dGTP diphosphatase
MSAKVFFDCPETFKPMLDVAACYCTHNDRILLLKRHPAKLEGSMWCMPGGKKEGDETLAEAAQRELFEESGLFVLPSCLQPVKQFFIEKPSYTFSFQVYHVRFSSLPTLVVKDGEITEGSWLSGEEALKKPLVMGGYEVLQYCLKTVQL